MEANTSVPPLEEACRAVGGTTKLAQMLTARLRARGIDRNVTKASVSRWKREGTPAEVCPDIEALSGVKCERLCEAPDWSVLRKKGAKAAPPVSDPA